MSLWLNGTDYASPYFMNWRYLINMTSLQMKLLEDMEWHYNFQFINDDLESVPLTYSYWNREKFMNDFKNRLNIQIMRL